MFSPENGVVLDQEENDMHLFIDADGCPAVRAAVHCALEHAVPVTLVCDTAHRFELPDAEVIYVDRGPDSADLCLANRIAPHDLAITQDYGLAALCLARGARAINPSGMEYTGENIDSLLLARHTARKLRNAGARLKGPSKRTSEQDRALITALERIFEE